MKNCKTLLTALIFSSLLFQGCEEPEEKHPPVIGSAVSITVDDKQAQMAPSTQALNEISNTIANILKVQLNELAQKEVPNFGNELQYCDISGLKQWVNDTTLNIKYEACQTQEHQQNGELELTYNKSENKWKYPTTLKLSIKNDYCFNQLTLKKNLNIESYISYASNMHIQSISFSTTGVLNFNYQTIKLENYPSTVNF